MTGKVALGFSFGGSNFKESSIDPPLVEFARGRTRTVREFLVRIKMNLFVLSGSIWARAHMVLEVGQAQREFVS